MRRKHILIIADHRPDRSPGQRYRFEQYLPHLKSLGFTWEFSYLLNEEDDRIFYNQGHYLSKAVMLIRHYQKRKKELKQSQNYDLVFVFRQALFTGNGSIERNWSKTGLPLVFDFDDAIWLPNSSQGNRFFSFLKRPLKTTSTIACATHVIAGNHYLAEYARNFNRAVSVIPTTIDLNLYTRQIDYPEKDCIIVGWSGSMTTIEHLREAEPVLIELKKRWGSRVRFKVIGDPSYRLAEADVQGIAWKAQTEVEDLLDIDIGMMPLPDNAWTRGKCGLKGLQYMALGIPTVMSAVGANKEIIQHGQNGLLASNYAEMTEQIELFIRDRALRERLGRRGRFTVEQSFGSKQWSEQFANLLDSLIR